MAPGKSPNIPNKSKVLHELTRMRIKGAREFTSLDIAKRCNLKSPGAAGVMLQPYLNEFGIRKHRWDSVYTFEED
ncbi:MAG: hypothetical protein PHX61_02550 [Alphaproteobacteria bacterium]|nr:hypothetical protein [Alphaproteobacteria bacterium]